MFNKRKEIDEIVLGANLYLKSLKESKQALAAQDTMVKSLQEPIAPLKNPFEDILERAKEGLKESREALVTQKIMVKTHQEPVSVYKERKITESFVSNKDALTNFEDILERAKKLVI